MKQRASVLFSFVLLAVVGCSDDDPAPGTGSPTGTSGGTGTPSASTSGIGDADLAACPQSTTLIETTDWVACLGGKTIKGADTFSNQPCELRIGADSSLQYYKGTELALSVGAKTSWRSGSGTYQNEKDVAGRRLFLASVTPDTEQVEGQPRLTRVTLTFFSIKDDTIEVEYLDATRNRQTYNCKVNVV